jgi:hypothetical protein
MRIAIIGASRGIGLELVIRARRPGIMPSPSRGTFAPNRLRI